MIVSELAIMNCSKRIQFSAHNQHEI